MPSPEFIQEQRMRTRQTLEIQRNEHLDRMIGISKQAEETETFLQEMDRLAERVRNMDDGQDVPIEEPAQPLAQETETRRERKKREEREKAAKKAHEQMRRVGQIEMTRKLQRVHMKYIDPRANAREYYEEEKLMREKIKGIDLIEKSKLLDEGDNISEETKLQIKWAAAVDRIEAVSDFARMLPIDSQKRLEVMQMKEEMELKADKMRRQLKVMGITDKEEHDREQATLSRHARFDFLKTIFRSENVLSREDAVCTLYKTDEAGNEIVTRRLVNIGRAFFGGTKPMYIFEDREAPIYGENGEITGYEQYLYKEAINCIGWDKPEGALVTEAAAKLQDIICGPYSIPAFSVEQDGKVIGSFQKKVESTRGPHVDLFQWQANPQAQEPLSGDVTDEILREHTLDWLLCNFDTKGENFLHRTDGHLCSFDKEASFRMIKDPEAAHMSTTYKPHSNDTLYNTIFTEFAEGRQMLNLSTAITQIEKAESIPDEAYLQMFDRMLTQKYGARSEKNTKRAAVERAMLERKTGLREEYRRFFTELIQRRREALAREGKTDDTERMLNQEGRFVFPGEGLDMLTEGTVSEDLLVEGITDQQLKTQGGTTYNLTLPKARAERMVAASNGFLTTRDNGNGTYTLRPSMPEKVTFAGEEIEFRRNYKRLTKMMAMLVVTTDGEIRQNMGESIDAVQDAIGNYQTYDTRQIREAEDKLRNVFLPMFRQDKTLQCGQTPEAAFQDFLKFMRYARGNVGGMNVGGMNVSVLGMEWMNSFKNITVYPARLAEAQQNGTIGEADLEAFRADLQRTREILARCASQDMDSEEVFLPGACSATARLVTTIMNPAEKLNQEEPNGELRQAPFNYHVPTIFEHVSDEALRAKVDALRETPMTDKQWEDLKSATRQGDEENGILAYTTYVYHTSGHIGELDGVHITLEAFAPEGHQLIGPGLTDEVGIGLFRTKEDFADFYGKDLNSINTLERQRRAEAKRRFVEQRND